MVLKSNPPNELQGEVQFLSVSVLPFSFLPIIGKPFKFFGLFLDKQTCTYIILLSSPYPSS